MLPEKHMCSGCGSCAVSCPKQCISMHADREGFRYPHMDLTKCIQCGLCERVCPVLHKPDIYKQTRAFAVKSKDDVVREQSSSGGFFSHLANYVLSNGGCVCAAAFDVEHKVCHRIIDNSEQLDLLRRAKYSQSEAEHCFPDIQQHLKNGKWVLFVGTPCQVVGLRTFLRQPYENLILVDMVCHGVPSPLVWERYLSDRKQFDASQAEISSVNMRSKVSGWSKYSYSMEIEYSNQEQYQSLQGQDWFMRGFTQNLYLRPSCENCSFKGASRSSDFTLGDYWGIWDQHPMFDDNKGVSLVLIHSEKGQHIYEQLSSLESMEVEIKEALVQNLSALKSSKPHEKRDKFFDLLHKRKSVIKCIEICLLPKQPSLWKRVSRKFCGK